MLSPSDETPSLDLEPDDGLEQLLGAAVHYCIATGPHAGRKALPKQELDLIRRRLRVAERHYRDTHGGG